MHACTFTSILLLLYFPFTSCMAMTMIISLTYPQHLEFKSKSKSKLPKSTHSPNRPSAFRFISIPFHWTSIVVCLLLLAAAVVVDRQDQDSSTSSNYKHLMGLLITYYLCIYVNFVWVYCTVYVRMAFLCMCAK